MTPWSYEAQGFTPDEHSEKYINLRPPKIKKFLSINKHDKNFFLLAPKGNGKTLLIKYKSYLYFNNADSPRDRPFSNELVENIVLGLTSFSAKDVSRFSELPIWVRIWTFSILYFVLSKEKEREAREKIKDGISELKPELVKILGRQNGVSTVANELLHRSTKLDDLWQYETHLVNLIREINRPIIHFLDRLDQNLGEFVAQGIWASKSTASEMANKLWVNCQIGLMSAIYNVNSINPHIKIYSTIRSEAFVPEKIPNQLYLNLKNFSIDLHYSKMELRDIFIKNIEMMDDDEYVNPDAEDPIERFLGFKKMPHRIAKEEDGVTEIEEDAFDFIYRHTFGRPREVVRLGNALYEELLKTTDYLEDTPRDRIEKVREVVNNVAYNDLFAAYTGEIIPSFRDLEFQEFLANIQSNVVPRAVVLAQNQDEIADYLYKLGLLGYVKSIDGSGNGDQMFQRAGEYMLKPDEKLPNSDFYVTHPTFDRKLLSTNPTFSFYDKRNIVGNTYKFVKTAAKNTLFTDIDYFLPKETNTEKWIKGNGKVYIKPIKKYYENYFSTVDHDQLQERVKRDKDRVQAALLDFSFFYFYHFIFTENIEMKNKCKMDVSRTPLHLNYQSELSDPGTEIEKFSDKLFGRLFTLGATIFLDMPVNQIHYFLTTNDHATFGFNPGDDAAFKYIQRCFFIHGFSRQTHRMNSQKKAVFQSTSSYEQELLFEFRRTLIEEFTIVQKSCNNKKERQAMEAFTSAIYMPAKSI